GYAEEWFDRELRTTLGIDVFDEPFDRERGWQILHARRADLLLLRTEDLDRTLPVGFAELTGTALPDVARENVRAETFDGRAYAEIWRRFRLPRDVVRRIYGGRLTRHFYGKDRIERFTARWSGPEDAA
ncbi:MAG: putative capsular polysaccharide synthesis family protein, partial [Myxococcota bacterium]